VAGTSAIFEQHVRRFEHLIFQRFWNTFALGGACGGWSVWWWLRTSAPGVVVDVAVFALLFVVNRVMAELAERETFGLLPTRLGRGLMAAAVAAAAGTGALLVAAAGWVALSVAGAIPAEAGMLAGVLELSPAFRPLGTVAMGLGIGLAAYGYFLGYRRLTIDAVEVHVPGLPPSLDGHRIAHISDLHVGPFCDSRALIHAFERVHELEPDVVLVTGDLVDTLYTDLGAWVPDLARLRAPGGVFAILGNHDCYAGYDRVADAVARWTSWRLLRDETAVIEREDGRLWLLGLEDRMPPESAAALPALLARVPAGEPTVLLTHRPDVFPAAAAAKVPLTLCGHTHGGQMAVPGLPRLNIARFLMTPFDGGWFRSGTSLLHVSRGLGTSGQRIRIGVPRDVSLIVLRCAEA
jgi:hypothetical protein